MSAVKRYSVFGTAIVVVCLIIGLAGDVWYEQVYAPAHESEWREHARAQWLQIAAARRTEDIRVHGVQMDGQLEDSRILLKCFKEGLPAAQHAAILATSANVDKE